MISIRRQEKEEWPAVWRIIEPELRAGETFAFPLDIYEHEARKVWVTVPAAPYVASNPQNTIVGKFYILPNQPGLGAHVCNCGYIVPEKARGQGTASQMCEHFQQEAIAQGYRAMQFNLVVSKNTDAVRLWQRKGFETIGTLPEAFAHSRQGFLDAFVMYKQLSSRDDESWGSHP